MYNLDIDTFQGSVAIVAANLETGKVSVIANILGSSQSVEYGSGFKSNGGSFSISSLPSGNSVTSLSKEKSNWTANAIGSIAAPAHGNASNGIFSIDGRSLGTDLNALGKGLYIVGGKKVLK